MSASILVTGGAGFIGSALVRACLERGDRVRVLDNFSTGKEENLTEVAGEIELVRGDLRDAQAVGQAVQGVDFVLHQAALASVPRSMADPLSSNAVNIDGTLLLLHAASKASVKRVVFASSSSVYGDTEVLPKVESMPLAPISPYAATKATGELYARVFTRAYGLETVSLRYFNVFGPRQDPASEYAAVIPRFIDALCTDRAPNIFGDGTQSRDFCFVSNVVQANLQALHADGAAGQVFNVALGERITLIELVDLLNSFVRPHDPIPPVFGPERAGDVKHSLADVSAAKAVLGYRPTVSVREGLRVTAEWFLARRGA